jgi:hypothetical protein
MTAYLPTRNDAETTAATAARSGTADLLKGTAILLFLPG